MKIIDKLLAEAKDLRTFGDTAEKCIGDGMRIATYELKALLMSIEYELSNTIEENRKLIIERAKYALEVEELTEQQLNDLFDLECSGDIFNSYDQVDTDNHSFDLGQYTLASRLIKLLE